MRRGGGLTHDELGERRKRNDGGDGALGTPGAGHGLVLLALAVLGGIWLVRRLRDEPAASPSLSGDAAGNKLRERYAAGEIDDEEYERRLSALTHWR